MMYQNELYHHGIKGMKWGVRRYRNADGTLTEKGKKKYDRTDKKWFRENVRYDTGSKKSMAIAGKEIREAGYAWKKYMDAFKKNPDSKETKKLYDEYQQKSLDELNKLVTLFEPPSKRTIKYVRDNFGNLEVTFLEEMPNNKQTHKTEQ